MGQLTQIKLIDFMNSNIILITSKNMTWFLKKLQDKKKIKKNIETMINWIDPNSPLTHVINFIEFNNFFYKLFF
jgi:hypothetical protein